MKCQAVRAAVVIALLGPAIACGALDTLWTVVYDPNGAGGYGTPVSVVVEQDHSVYVFGTYPSPSGSGPLLTTVRHRPDGGVAWAFQHPESTRSSARAMCLHTNGGVVVSGSNVVRGAWTKTVTVRYDTAGTELWGHEYYVDSARTEPRAVAVDQFGNTYVGGFSEDQAGDASMMVLKYDVAGAPAWETWYDEDTTGVFDDAVVAIAVDSAGGVYTAGTSHRRAGTRGVELGMLLKFSGPGAPDWVSSHLAVDSYPTVPVAVAVDRHGDVLMSATESYGTTGEALLLRKFGPVGNELWTRRWHSPDGRGTRVKAFALDREDNGYVLGEVSGGPTGNDVVIVKYDPEGEVDWTAWYRDSLYDSPAGIALGPSGVIYVCGKKSDTSSARPAMMLEFDREGTYIGRHLVHWGEGFAVAANEAGQVFVAGMRREEPSSGNEWTLYSYARTGDPRDVGCVNILAPRGQVASGSVVIPVAWLRNYGTLTESYPVRMTIGAGYDEVVQVNGHPPRQAVRVEFPQWTAATPGRYAVRCSTRCPDDPRPDNDAWSDTVQVGPPGVSETGPVAVLAGLDLVPLTRRDVGLRVRLVLEREARVQLAVFDVLGRETRRLGHAQLAAGTHWFRWDGNDEGGRRAAAGVYCLAVVAEGQRTARRLLLVE